MARTRSSLKEKVAGCRIRRQLEVLMVFTQVLIGSFVFPLNSRFNNILGFSGCLLLDPLRFISYHLLVIGR